uniref:Small ribosomal subunit protein uS4c n=1 Tax=Ishige okamurae TaxID=233772 RepID=A0A8E5XRG0_9PHAE|nr:ribosomal protein S4 [Ishige okamurae]QVJ99652.1 ribosomal protein S4 [Ishige okamurae]
MARYRGPRLKIVRRLGELPGLTRKVISTKTERQSQDKNTGLQKKNQKGSTFKIRLCEKQKLRYNYGIAESQLRKYVIEARRRKGLTGFLLLQLLEMRVDNIIYRLGLVPTIPAARQFITHGHVLINKRRVNIPSFQCQPNDFITFSTRPEIIQLLKSNLDQSNSTAETFENKEISNQHLEFDPKSLTVKIKDLVNRNDVSLQINDMLVIEYYSRLA